MENKITFNTNIDKAIEVILWFCSRKNGRINKYNLLKSLFYAEVEHLNNYGRPIIGDTYHALPYGTVPSLIRDLIEKNKFSMNTNNIKTLPFDLEGNFVKAKRDFNKNLFSKSDIKCLESSFSKYGNLPFGELCDLNHEHKAWKQVRNEDPNGAIPFELLIKDQELIEELKEVSRDMVI